MKKNDTSLRGGTYGASSGFGLWAGTLRGRLVYDIRLHTIRNLFGYFYHNATLLHFVLVDTRRVTASFCCEL